MIASWGSVWQQDTPQQPVNGRWRELIESFHASAPLGALAPDFAGPTVSGAPYALGDAAHRAVTVILFGSITCPPFVAALSTGQPGLLELARRYRESGVEFVCVYSREAHPGNRIRPPATFADRELLARQLVTEESIGFPVVIDDMADSIHRRYCDVSFNSPVFLASRGGYLVYKSAWLDPADLAAAIESHLVWQGQLDRGVILKKTYSERLQLIVEQPAADWRKRTRAVLERAGTEFADPWSAIPAEPPRG